MKWGWLWCFRRKRNNSDSYMNMSHILPQVLNSDYLSDQQQQTEQSDNQQQEQVEQEQPTESSCNCTNHTVNLQCSCFAPRSAAELMRCSRRSQNAESSSQLQSTNGSSQGPPETSTSTQTYITAPNGQNNQSVTSEGEEISIDFDDTVEDDSRGPQYSINSADESHIQIEDKKKFYDTVTDSPVTYQDRFGRSQSMRRYSSAITDRRQALAQRDHSPTHDVHVDFDPEPLELSCLVEDSTQISILHTPGRVSRVVEDSTQTSDLQPPEQANLPDDDDVRFLYVDELRERLPEIRSSLRPTFPNFNQPSDIGDFLADNDTLVGAAVDPDDHKTPSLTPCQSISSRPLSNCGHGSMELRSRRNSE